MSAAHQTNKQFISNLYCFVFADNCIGKFWCDNIDMRNKQCVINHTQELLYFSTLIVIDNKNTSWINWKRKYFC
jgi:hypothetical protein